MVHHEGDLINDSIIGRRLGFSSILLGWAAAVIFLAAVGFVAYLPTQLLPVPVVIGMTTPLAVYTLSRRFRAFIYRIDLRWLTLFNVWRVPAALAFFWYGAQALLPQPFVFNAAWGDLIAGVLAPLALFWDRLGQRWRIRSYIAFHLFSIADFIVAVGTGFTFSLLRDPLMDTLKLFPMAIIPLFGVPLTGALSLMTLHRLLTRKA
jgi:hypothetical protein